MIKEYLFYNIYQNQISPFLYFYNENDVLISCRWLLGKEFFINENIQNKKWDLFEEELDLYFREKFTDFRIKLFRHFQDSSFTNSVLEELKSISFGNIETYKSIASRLNNPGSARAVGSICRKNPFPIIIPCHRVVGKNNIGGYMGRKNQSMELSIKAKLLQFEGLDLNKINSN